MALSPLSPYRNLLRTGMRWVWGWLVRIRLVLQALRQRLPAPVKRVIRRIGRITAGTMVWVVVAIIGLFVVAHFWLPTIAEKKSEIEQYLSQTVGNPVELGELQTFWDGLNPGMRIRDLRILTAAGEPALRLHQTQLSLSWRALLFGNVEISNLTLIAPQLSVERLPDGTLRLTGLMAQAADPGGLPDFSDWLLRQREIMIVNGVLQWTDHVGSIGREGAEQMTIRSVQASIRNDGSHHAFVLRASLPEGLCKSCQASGEFIGNPFHGDDWSGEFRVDGQQLRLQRLPNVVRQQLPTGLSGNVSATLAGRWKGARLEEVNGRLHVQDFSVTVGQQADKLAFRLVDTGLRWRGESGRWRLQLSGLRLAHSGPVWTAGRVDIDAREDEGRLQVEHVNLTDAVGFLAGRPQAKPLSGWLQAAQPGGWLHHLQVTWGGTPLAPTTYRVDTRASNLQIKAAGVIPGVTGLSGHLVVAPNEGEFRIDSHAGRLDAPKVMYASIPFARMVGHVRWVREENEWQVQGSGLDLRNADAHVDGNVELRIPHDTGRSPIIKLGVRLQEGNGESVDRYFPRVTPDALRAYLRRAIQGGRVTNATAVVEGALSDFPYLAGNGKFEVRAQVKNGQLEYLPNWTPLRALDVDMLFTGRGMLLTADTGSLRNLHVNRVAVEIEDFFAPQGVVLNVRGHASGPITDAVTVLRDSKSPWFRAWLLPGLSMSGQGVLDLDLRVPLTTNTETTLNGEYRVAGGRLLLAPDQPPIDAVQGLAVFDQNGLRSGQLDARWLGSELQLKAVPDTRQGTDISLRGGMDGDHLSRFLGPALSQRVAGQVPWRLQWRKTAARSDISLKADLKDLEIRLPAPLAKARGETQLLELRTSGMEGDVLSMDLQAGHRAAGRLIWQRRDDQWSLRRGSLALGERTVPPLPPDGLQVSARLPEFNFDRWWPILQPMWNASESGGEPSLVNRVSLDIATLYFLDRTFGRLSLDMVRGPGFWSGHLDGESVSGRGQITLPVTDQPVGLQLVLDRLAVPQALPSADTGTVDPRKLPAVQLKSESFRYDRYDLGALDFTAEPSFSGWRIASLKLKRPETQLKASGQWAINRLGTQSSRFDVAVNSSDFGRTLKEFGYRDELAGGNLNLDSSWHWHGAPGGFTLATLNGDLTFDLKNGRFPRISQGASRLFGAFDLRSVVRMLTLDFSSLVAKGLTFDDLHGKLEVENGNAYTRNLEIQVAGADIELRGRIGLAARDLDLVMEVTPRVSTNLAPVIGGAILGGPVVGGAIAVLGGVTGNPLGKTTRTDYTVKGQWDDPKVESVGGTEKTGESDKP